MRSNMGVPNSFETLGKAPHERLGVERDFWTSDHSFVPARTHITCRVGA